MCEASGTHDRRRLVQKGLAPDQHKNDADFAAVANALARTPNTRARELAVKMRALRPHLMYDFPEDAP